MAHIGLIDVDGHNFPNLALMKISSFHKSIGDNVEWYNGIEKYDKVYLSKVFTFSQDEMRVIQAEEVVRGGSGYRLYDQWLDVNIEHMCPDYSLYPKYTSAYGFTTRGCVNRCSFCVVPLKEGFIKPHSDITEFIADKKRVILMDNNIIASEHGVSQLEKCISMKIEVDINQGIDARIISKDRSIAKILSNLKWINYIRMAYDNTAITEEVVEAISLLKEAGIPTRKMMFYVLAKDGAINDAEQRVMLLDRLGVSPFVMPYRDLQNQEEPSKELKRFARWCNVKSIFKSCEFSKYK